MDKKFNLLLTILKKTFPNQKIPNRKNLKANDFDQWDSLGHLNFLLSVEKFFKVKFSLKEMTELKDFKNILISINKKK